MTAVREARPSDRTAIAAVHTAAIEAFGPQAYDDGEVAAWMASDRSPAERYDLDEGHWVVAERDGDVAGFGSLDTDECEVVGIYVHPDHARRGVGTVLLTELERYGRGVGCPELTLTASRNAVEFYERAGYDREAVEAYETSVGVELDCVRMRKAL